MRVVFGLFLALVTSAGKPPHENVADVARWTLYHSVWATLVTRSKDLQGAPLGSPISVADALNNGTPFFFMSTTMQDSIVGPDATLALSEAAIDCSTVKLDANDPRCVQVRFAGQVVKVTNMTELKLAKSYLFGRPLMKQWPVDHNWQVMKLNTEHIQLTDYFGGGVDVPLEDYARAQPPRDVMPINATQIPSTQKPPVANKVARARWLMHESYWGVLATASARLDGKPSGNVFSVADRSMGIPYFYVTYMDASMQDLQQSPSCTLTLSEASLDCRLNHWYPEDPRCTRLHLMGTMVNVTNAREMKDAKEALFATHPSMRHWPPDHGFHITKLNISHVWLIDFFEGRNNISPQDYLAAQFSDMTSV